MALVVGASPALAACRCRPCWTTPLASPYTLGLAAAAGLGRGAGPLHRRPRAAALDCHPGRRLHCVHVCRLPAVWPGHDAPHQQPDPDPWRASPCCSCSSPCSPLLQFLSSPELNQQILFWLFGSLMRTTWDALIITAAVTPDLHPAHLPGCLGPSPACAWEARARSLGVNVDRLHEDPGAGRLAHRHCHQLAGVIGFCRPGGSIARMLVGKISALIPCPPLCGPACCRRPRCYPSPSSREPCFPSASSPRSLACPSSSG